MREMFRQLARRIRAPRRAAATKPARRIRSVVQHRGNGQPCRSTRRYLARTIDVSKVPGALVIEAQARTFERDSVMLTINTAKEEVMW